MPALGADADDAATPGVLILHSNQRPTPAQIIIEDTLRTVVPDGLERPVELFSEHLDDERTSLQMQERFRRTSFAPNTGNAIALADIWHFAGAGLKICRCRRRALHAEHADVAGKQPAAAGGLEVACSAAILMTRTATLAAKRTLWLDFARWLVAGLTFQLAADIGATAYRQSEIRRSGCRHDLMRREVARAMSRTPADEAAVARLYARA